MSGLVLLLIILFCIFINNFLHYWITRAEMVFNRFWYALKCILNCFFLSCFFVVFSCVIFYCFILYCYYHFVLFCIVISILLNFVLLLPFCFIGWCPAEIRTCYAAQRRVAVNKESISSNSNKYFKNIPRNILRIFQEIFWEYSKKYFKNIPKNILRIFQEIFWEYFT